MPRRRAQGWALVAALAAFGLPNLAHGISSSKAQSVAKTAIQHVERDVGTVKAAVAKAKSARITPERRIAAGDVLLRQKDYERAIHTFSQLVELHRQGKVPEVAYADGLFLLGESYFQDRQYLSARRHFREVLDKGNRSPFDRYAGRALSRLVDVALRTGDLDSLDDVFARMNQLPASDATGSLQYARGKALYARKDYAAARSALNGLGTSSEYAHQAQYLIGVMLVKEATPAPPPELPTEAAPEAPAEGAEGDTPTPAPAPAKPPELDRKRYAGAIEQFRKVTRLPPDTKAHRHVIDLAWMAIGRLFYETDNYLDSAEAYSHVDRKSPEFTNMLYELAWVYVRLGDYTRAERALEILAIIDPNSVNFADGSLLRADLMLRSGQFEKALTLYQSVRSQFDPIREQVDAFLSSTSDPAVYYDRLVEDPLERGDAETVPDVAIEWAREAAEGDRAFAVIDDVTRSRDLIKKSRRLAQKLNAVLGSSTRAKAFPELRAGLEQTLGLLNKVGKARLTLAKGMDDASSGSGSGELADVRRERRSLMKRLKWIPVTPGDFARRESSGEKQWNKVSQSLQRLTLEADRLQAIVNGLKRVLKDADQHGVASEAQSRQRFQAEIEANERDLALYRQRIREYRDAIELGRVQIGFGDQRFVDDERVRRRFREVFNREVQLVASGGSGASYAKAIQPLLRRADAVESSLESTKADFDSQIRAKAADLQKQVNQEAANIAQYSDQLDALDQQARLLVGEMAMRNFGLVRDRLKSIVLRADVGIVQEAWELREVQRLRVRDLQRERSREEQNLNDELREVLDDAGDDL